MLKKVTRVRSVGTLSGLSNKGDVAMRAFTVIWGGNASGKSTLCDVLRSFSTGDATPIFGRRTLGAAEDPEVDLLFDDGVRRFRAGAWEKPGEPQFQVYDNCYVHDNIYIGDFVEHEQKKNLYRVIVGAVGVALATTVDNLDEQLRAATKDAATKRDNLKSWLAAGIDVDGYLALVPDPSIDGKISIKEKELAAAQQAAVISKRPKLSLIQLPTAPPVDHLLGQTIESIGRDSEMRVSEHIRSTHVREAWLSEGLRAVTEDQCPFCGQQVGGSELISAFRGYFSESYGALKQQVSQLIQSVETNFGTPVQQRLSDVVKRNGELASEWQQLTGVIFDERINISPLASFGTDLLTVLRRKEAAPLESIEGLAGWPSLEAYGELQRSVSRYNEKIEELNQQIDSVKASALSANAAAVKSELDRLICHRDRFLADRTKACDAAVAAARLRVELDAQKKTAKETLDAHADKILGKSQAAINRYLQKFGATFGIKRLERRYSGGSPSSSYALEINNVQVDLGDRKTAKDEPSFRNTLSGGDRSALALAFFLAQLEVDEELNKKVVVLDDPFTSQDRSRRACTVQEIKALRGRAVQVIVVSHDESFLEDCCRDVASGDTKLLRIRPILGGSVLEEWSPSPVKAEILQLRQKLKNFCAGTGDGSQEELRGTRADIRVLLEAYLRNRFPELFTATNWLGDMVKTLRDNVGSFPEGTTLPDEIAQLNDYSKDPHHASKTGEYQIIDETELRAWTLRALKVTEGF